MPGDFRDPSVVLCYVFLLIVFVCWAALFIQPFTPGGKKERMRRQKDEEYQEWIRLRDGKF